jgi:hypothetical protein
MASFEHLPKSLKPFFWDHSFSKLSLNTDRDLIIRRILSSGSWEAVLWLKKKIGDKNLKKWLVSYQGRGLSPRQLRYWGLILDLPDVQVNKWVNSAKENPWGKR